MTVNGYDFRRDAAYNVVMTHCWTGVETEFTTDEWDLICLDLERSKAEVDREEEEFA